MSYTLDRIRTAADRHTPAVVGGWAALYVHGLREPDNDGLLGWSERPVDLVVPAQAGRRAPRGTRLRATDEAPIPSQRTHGIEVSPPARAVFDAARWEHDPARTLAWLDQALRAGICDRSELLALTDEGRRRHGIRNLRATLGWASARAESPMESRTRYAWLTAGIGWPMVNPQVYTVDGTFLGRPDLLDPATGLCAEFQGQAFHAREDQRDADSLRFARFRAAGLTPVALWGPMLTAGDAGAALHAGLLVARGARRRWVVGAEEDLPRLRVGLLASSGWGQPLLASAPLERLVG